MKYSPDDIEKIYQDTKKKTIEVPVKRKLPVQTVVRKDSNVKVLPTANDKSNKVLDFVKTAGYRSLGETSNTVDAFTYLKKYKMGESADRLEKRSKNAGKNNITLNDKQKVFLEVAKQIDVNNLENQTDTTKKLLSKSFESEQRLKKGNGPVANTLIDIGLAGTDMLTKAGVSALTGAPLPVLIGLTSGANTFQDDINKGIGIDKALQSGVGSGIISGGVESLTGIGASKFSTAIGSKAGAKLLGKMPDKVSKYLTKVNGSVIGKVLKGAGGEGIEEAIEYDAQRVYRNLIMDEDTPRDVKEQAYNALIGAGVGGLFGGGKAIGNFAVDRVNNKLPKANDMTNNTNQQTNDVESQNMTSNDTIGVLDSKNDRFIPKIKSDVALDSDLSENVVENNLDPNKASVNEKNINTSSKVEQYQKRQENYFISNIADSLGISKYADKSSLKGLVNDLTTDLKSNETIAPEKLNKVFDTIVEEGIIVDLDFYKQYKGLKNQVRNTKLYVSDSVKADFQKGEYNNFRKTNLGNLTLTKDSNAMNIDSYYQELSESNPEMFPKDIVHPADQLRQIADVQNSIVKTESDLSLYMNNNAEYKQWARREFDVAVDKLSKEAKQVKKVQDEKIDKLEKKAIDKEMVKNTKAHDMHQIHDMKNLYQKKYDTVMRKEILTDRDKVQIDRLVKGEITLDELPKGVNVSGIKNVYEAKVPLENVRKMIKDYNKSHKAVLRESADELIINSDAWKDKASGFQYQRETMERNIRDIVPDKQEAKAITDTYITPIHENEAKATKLKNSMRDMVRKLNLQDKNVYEVAYEAENGLPFIEKVSERALVQLLGEGKVKVDMIKKTGADVNKIENAVNEFRSIYDKLIIESNNILIENGYSPVEYRKDYFPHFTDDKVDNLLGKLGSLVGLDVNTKELPTDIAGLTHTFKPGKKYVGNFLQRTTDTTDYDAVKGFDRYIEGVADVIHHTGDIQRLRAFEESLRYKHSSDGIRAEIDKIRENDIISELDKVNRIEEIYQTDKSKLPHFVTELRNYTDSLAGKKSIQDRNMEHTLGRGMYEIAKAMENRVASNMVAINPGSWLTNFIPLTQGLGGVKTTNLLNGMKDTISSYAKNDGFRDKSTFLVNRAGSEALVKSKLEKASRTLASPMQMIDNFTSETLVRSRYYENMRNGMPDVEAIKNADKWVAGLMADRSKGSLPTLFNEKNPITKTFTMFQLEVNNQLSYYFKDVPDELKEKGVAALAMAFSKMFIGSFLYNELFEKLTGRRAALDPIDLIADAIGDFKDEDKNTYKAVANTARGFVEEMPFVGGLIGGGRLPISSAIPDVGNVFKSVTGLATGEMPTNKALSVLGKEAAKPATYFLLPFGGGQVKKAVEGINTVSKGGSFGVDSQGRDTLQFPAERSLKNYAKSMAFGKYSLPKAKDYVDSGFKSLSGPYTGKYKEALDNGFTSDEFLNTYNAQRKAESDKDSNGDTIYLSLAKNKKKAIDGVNKDMDKNKLEMLYQYFDVSEKIWKNEVISKKNSLPTLKEVSINRKLPTIKKKE